MNDVNWRGLLFSMLMVALRWLQEEISEEDKQQIRDKERVIFPGDDDPRVDD